MGLPYGYTRLRYIENSGTQYINTEFKPNQNTRVLMDMEFAVSTQTNVQAMFGARVAYANAAFYVFCQSNYAGYQHAHGAKVNTTTTPNAFGRHTVDKNANALIVDGVSINTATASTFSTTFPIFLFTVNNGGNPMTSGNPSKMRLYSCEIYDNGTLVRNYIPCKNSSGKIGLYDDVNAKFYGNAGTGEFQAGDVVLTGVHQTLVDGVGWEVLSGRCLVDGVGYGILKGRTLADGVGYDVAFKQEAATVSVSLKQLGSSSYADAGQVTIDGTVYNGSSAPITLDVEIGSEILCKALAPNQFGFDAYEAAAIKLNGKTVASGYSGTVNYTYTVVGNTEISLGLVGSHGEVQIVEL